MNKEQQKNEIAFIAKLLIGTNTKIDFAKDCAELNSNDIDHIAEQIAEKLYDEGYQKIDGENCAPIEWCYEQIIKAKRELEEQQRKYCHDYGKIRKMDAMEFAARLKYRISNLPDDLQSVIINIIDSEVEIF